MVNEKRSERISFYSHWYSVHVSSIYFHWILSFWQTFALDTPSKCWIRVYFHSTPKSFTKKNCCNHWNWCWTELRFVHFHYELRAANAFLLYDSKWWWIMTCARVFFHVSYKIYELKSTTKKSKENNTKTWISMRLWMKKRQKKPSRMSMM